MLLNLSIKLGCGLDSLSSLACVDMVQCDDDGARGDGKPVVSGEELIGDVDTQPVLQLQYDAYLDVMCGTEPDFEAVYHDLLV